MTIGKVMESLDSPKLLKVPRLIEAADICLGLATRPTQDVMRKLCGDGLSQTELAEIVSASILAGFQVGYVTGLLHPEERPTLTGVIKPL